MTKSSPLQELLAAFAHSKHDQQHDQQQQHNDEIRSTVPTSDERHDNDDDKDEEPESMKKKKKKNKSLTTVDRFVQHLQEEEWRYSIDHGKDIIYTNATGSNGSFRIVIDVKEQDDMAIVYVFSPVRVPEGIHRSRMAEFLTRANYGVMIGNFEMDLGDGELRYKGSIDFEGGELTKAMIQNLIGKCAYTMNRYFPGIMRIIYADLEAATAIREIEPSQSRGGGGGDDGAPVQALAVQVLEALQQDAAAASPGESPEVSGEAVTAQEVEAEPADDAETTTID